MLDFPNSPTNGQIFNGTGGGVWRWDGVKWVSVPNVSSGGGSDNTGGALNVIDFGADPTGAVDSSTAFNTAAAQVDAHGRRKSVYVPGGFYRINDQINLVNGQSLFGDGRSVSEIFCDGNFNMSAAALILLNTTTVSLDPGTEIRDISITMAQNMSNTLRSQCIQYPPAISCQVSCGRPKILHCRINGAWTGFTTNGFNVPFYIDDLELGALGTGLSIGLGADGPQEFCHVHGLHFWAFGCPLTPFQDGNTVCIAIGRCDGIDFTDVSCFEGQINVSSVNSGATVTTWTNLKFDTDRASMSIQGGLFHQISNMYTSAGTGRTRAGLTVNGSTSVTVNGWYSHNSSPFPMFDVQAGELSIENAHIRHYALGTPIGQTSNANALLKVVNATVWLGAAGVYTAPLFVQGGGTSRLQIDKLNLDPIGNVNSGTAVSIATDILGNTLGSVSLPSGWTVNFPATAGNTQPYYPAGARFGATGNFTVLNATTQIALTGGLIAGGPTDLSQAAILLFAGYGFNVTPNLINMIVGGVNVGAFTTYGLGLSTQGGLVAAGTTQGTALAITAAYNNVSTVAANTGVILPSPGATGVRLVVWNHGANTLNIYPAVGHSINALANNAPLTVAAGAKAALIYWGGLWLQED